MSKEKKNEPLRFGKHGDAAVSAPRYVRKIGKGYEYSLFNRFDHLGDGFNRDCPDFGKNAFAVSLMK